MMAWLKRNKDAVQALGTIVTALAALAALIGVKLQIDASALQQREQSAREIYREFLSLSISRPELAEPDYCAIRGSAGEAAYDSYLEYLLYTSEQLLSVSSDWEATFSDHLGAHREALCSRDDWSDDTREVQALISRFRAKQCAGFVSECAE